MSATTLAAPHGIPGPSLPAALSAFLSGGKACDFVLAMTERYGRIWRIPGAVPLVVPGREAHFQEVLVRSQRKVGKGAVAVLPTIVLNRSAPRWKDPQAFRPERFEGADPRPDHYPYGLGPRYCIGAGDSQGAMPLLLEHFLRSLELLSAVPRISHSLPLSLRFTWVRLTARS